MFKHWSDWQLYWHAQRFHRHRADYYDYLAVLLQQGGSRKTLLDIFCDDATRYGSHHFRGFLAGHWASRYRECGGDLGQTFLGVLPNDELALLRTAQLAGGDALAVGLGDLALTVRLLDQAHSTVFATLATAGLAGALSLSMVVATPGYTVPTLQQTFQVVPTELLGPWAAGLYQLAAGLSWSMPVLLSLLVVLPILVFWSLPWATGRVRASLDSWFIWRLYRDFQGLRFLALLASLVRPRAGLGMSLRDALMAQWPGARRWKRWHLQRMVEHVDDGIADVRTFATGLLDRELQWFLTDMLALHGMDEGLARTRERLEAQWLSQLTRRAVRLRWVVMLLALGVLLGLLLWHYAAIDELRRSLQTFYAMSH